MILGLQIEIYSLLGMGNTDPGKRPPIDKALSKVGPRIIGAVTHQGWGEILPFAQNFTPPQSPYCNTLLNIDLPNLALS